jgi:hypothetical protein
VAELGTWTSRSILRRSIGLGASWGAAIAVGWLAVISLLLFVVSFGTTAGTVPFFARFALPGILKLALPAALVGAAGGTICGLAGCAALLAARRVVDGRVGLARLAAGLGAMLPLLMLLLVISVSEGASDTGIQWWTVAFYATASSFAAGVALGPRAAYGRAPLRPATSFLAVRQSAALGVVIPSVLLAFSWWFITFWAEPKCLRALGTLGACDPLGPIARAAVVGQVIAISAALIHAALGRGRSPRNMARATCLIVGCSMFWASVACILAIQWPTGP